ncbi:hypothetical protein GCM10027074_67220 [Streptomyces deserti]
MFGQPGAGPVTLVLEQRQQFEQPRGSLQHVRQTPTCSGAILSYLPLGEESALLSMLMATSRRRKAENVRLYVKPSPEEVVEVTGLGGTR